MRAVTIEFIKNSIAESAETYFYSTGEKVSDELLLLFVDALVDEYKGKRQYPAYFTEEQIEADVTRYFGRKKTYFAMKAIPEMVGRIGAEGLHSLSDNQVNRIWDIETYLADVLPYCEVL